VFFHHATGPAPSGLLNAVGTPASRSCLEFGSGVR
jgi:hypothetical protein